MTSDLQNNETVSTGVAAQNGEGERAREGESRRNRYEENFMVSRQKGGRVSLFGSARPVRPIIINMPEEEK